MIELLKLTEDHNRPGCYKLWVTAVDEQPIISYAHTDHDTTAFVVVTKNGVCQYGLRQHVARHGEPAGYVWSSRPGVMNQYFDVQIVNAHVNNISCRALTVEAVKKILPKEYYLVKETSFEPNYIIIKNK